MEEESTTTLATFRTPKGHVIGEVFFVLLTVPVILIMGLVAAGFSAYMVVLIIPDDKFTGSPILALVVAVLVFAFFCCLAWLGAKDRLKFTLRIGPQELSFGERPFRESIPCLAVETIRETAERLYDPHSYRVELTAPGIKWKFFFGSFCGDCIEALRAVCTNAVFVDARGQEHLPEGTHSPIRAIRNLVRTRLRRATAALLLSIPCLAWSAVVFAAIIARIVGGETIHEVMDGIHGRFFTFLGIPLLGVFSLVTAIMQFAKAKRLSKRMRAHIKPGLEDIILEDAIDLSKSEMESV